MTTGKIMNEAIFDKLFELRTEVKGLLLDIPEEVDKTGLFYIYGHNMAVYECITKIDHYLWEVM